MKKITHYLLLSIGFIWSYTLSAQQDLTLYNMEMNPQRLSVNPAFFPAYSKVNIGLPVISSTYFNLSNSGFKYSDLVKHYNNDPRYKDSLYVDYNNMLSKLKANNYLTTALQIDILSFGFAVKKNYFSFNITEKANFSFRYPKGFMQFIGQGNGGLLGQDVNFNFGIDFTHYREYGLGYSRKVNDKLTVGGKVKYLYGMENVQTETSDISVNTDPTNFAITAQANVKINSSINTGNFNASQYLFKKKNNGMGIDLGAEYKLNDKFSFSGSLIDLGFIKWNQDVTTYQSANPNSKFVFQGLDMNQLINADSSKNPTKIVTDSLNKMMKIDTIHKSYTTHLSSKIYLGANYNLTDKIKTGVLFYGQIYDKQIHPALALSYNQIVGRWLNYSLSYSMYNRSYNNIGVGLGLNIGSVQWYMISDNLLGAIFPQNTKNIHLHAGVNLRFGRAKKDKDKDGIADNKDKCPDVPGILEFNGCPDKDKDHVPDKDDLCPNDSGSVEFKGCPDRDGDKIIDITDSCPDIAGLAEFHGCPDKDGDKIIDKLDDCPDVAGLPQFKGCPDRDGDGVMDKIDLCPDKAGPASNNGCPENKLNVIDTLGATIKTVVAAKDGSFTFDNLPSDDLVRFKLESDKADSINEVNVIIGGITKKAVKDSTGKYFHFVIAKQAVAPEPVQEVTVKLDAQEAEVLKKAFNNLEFASAKGIIKEESFPSLDELATLMTKKPNWRLKISGHTDNQGNAVTNMKLSEKRAEAIKKHLVDKGIAPDRFKVEWFGATKPIADNKTEEGRQKNRRVEMLIIE